MGKIFLIEPHRILQQAIALSLFPEHDVQVAEAADAATVDALKEIELLIIDAAALRESDKLSPEINRAIQSSSIPTMWIDEAESAESPKRDKLAVVLKPIESGVFQSAIAGLLSSSNPKNAKKSAVSGEPKARKSKGVQQAGAEPIELVEIVDDGSPSDQDKTPGT
jgi:hypothetical protein